MLESEIEKICCKWALSEGWISYKFVSPSKRGVPDRMFLRDGKTVFVEFKRPGGIVSKIQEREIEKLRAQSFKVFVITSLRSMQIAFTR